MSSTPTGSALLLAGVVLRAHGLRGEVVRRRAHRLARRPVRRRCRAGRAAPGAPDGALTHRVEPGRTPGGCSCASSRRPTARPPKRCAAPASSSPPPPSRLPTTPTSSTSTSSKACAPSWWTAPSSAWSRDVIHGPGGELLVAPPRGRRRRARPVRARDRPDRRRGGRPRGAHTARGPPGLIATIALSGIAIAVKPPLQGDLARIRSRRCRAGAPSPSRPAPRSRSGRTGRARPA